MALRQSELKASSRRNHTSRMRELKRGTRRVEKLMNTVSSFETALQLIISENPNIQEVILVLGGSPLRPQHVYQLFFSHGKSVPRDGVDFTKSKVAEGLSRKVHLNYLYFDYLLLFGLISCECFFCWSIGYSSVDLKGCWIWFLSR